MEMGKTDIRDPHRVLADHPGVDYRAFDAYELSPDLRHELFRDVMDLFADKRVNLNPISVRNIRDARGAFREMSQGRHIGKLVIEVGGSFGGGTVLVTGGTGEWARWWRGTSSPNTVCGVWCWRAVGDRRPTA